MADQGRKLEQKLQALPFDMRALLHLAIWASAAAAALMIAVLSAYLSLRPQRAAIVVADPAPVQHAQPQPPAITTQLAARTAEAETEVRRLSQVVLALGTDRDQLVARIGSLERSLEDVTGAIHRQAAPPPIEPAPLPASPAVPLSLPLPQPRPQTSSQAEAAVVSAPQPAAAVPPAADLAAGAIGAAGAPARGAPVAEPATGGEFGVDVGGAAKFDGLRTLWHSITNANPDLFEGLHPIVAVRESRSRGVDLRLIVGPLASTEAATRLCAALMAARRYCQMTTFEGQALALSAPEPERRPAATTRNPASASASNASASKRSPAPASANSAGATGNPAPISSGTTARTQARPRP